MAARSEFERLFCPELPPENKFQYNLVAVDIFQNIMKFCCFHEDVGKKSVWKYNLFLGS